MKKRYNVLILVFFVILLSVQASAFAETRDLQSVQYYTIELSTGDLIYEGPSHTVQTFPGIGETEHFTVDGIRNEITLVNAVYNHEKTQNTPYVGLRRVASLANGQSTSTSETMKVDTSTVTTNMSSSSNTFSFGVTLDSSGGFLGKIVGEFLTSISASSETSFKKTHTTTDTDTVLESISNTHTETFSIPSFSQFNLSNSADFYTVTHYDVYDVVLYLAEAEYTDDPAIGIVSATQVYHEDVVNLPPDQLACYWCIELTNLHGSIYHVEYGNGWIEHYTVAEFLNTDFKYYIPGYTPESTTVVTEYYVPSILKFSVPWFYNQQNTLTLNKPIKMAVENAEQVVYRNGAPYLIRHVDSNLLSPSDSTTIVAPFDSVTSGNTISTNYTGSISTTSKNEIIKTTGWTNDSSLTVSLQKYMTFTAGYKGAWNSSDTTSTTNTTTESISITNNYQMPQGFVQEGYDGITLHSTKDGITFQVIGEIIPINSDGSLDLSKKQTVEYEHREEFHRTYAKPYNVFSKSR